MILVRSAVLEPIAVVGATTTLARFPSAALAYRTACDCESVAREKYINAYPVVHVFFICTEASYKSVGQNFTDYMYEYGLHCKLYNVVAW